MAFKGGTSLSKIFGAIARFSEDVDITLDYRGPDGSFDPFAEGVSKTRLRKFSEDGEQMRLHYPSVLESPGDRNQCRQRQLAVSGEAFGIA